MTLPTLLGLALSTGGFGYAFASAVRTGRLSTLAIVLGAASLLCGIGAVPFLAVGFKAVQAATFAAVAEGAQPAAAGQRMTRYKMAAAATVAGLLLLAVAGRLPSGDRHMSSVDDVEIDR